MIYYVSLANNVSQEKQSFVLNLPSIIYQSNSSSPVHLRLVSCSFNGWADPPNEPGPIELGIICDELRTNFTLSPHGQYGALGLLEANIFKRGLVKGHNSLPFSNCVLKQNPSVTKLTFKPIILSNPTMDFKSVTTFIVCFEIVPKDSESDS